MIEPGDAVINDDCDSVPHRLHGTAYNLSMMAASTGLRGRESISAYRKEKEVMQELSGNHRPEITLSAFSRPDNTRSHRRTKAKTQSKDSQEEL